MIVFLIVILLLAALMEWLSLRGGAACADGDFSLSKTRAEADEPVEMTVSARNTGRLPITYLALRIAFPPAADLPDTADARMERSLRVVTETFRLWGRSAKERTLRFRISTRGVHTLSGRELARGDFLGLRLISRQLDRRQVLLVYPRRLESPALAEAVGNDCGAMSARRWLLRDPVLTLGVREYTGTEPMRTISWSQTARRGELMVREFDYTRTLNCAVLLSVSGLGADEDALLDRCCGAARTVCETLIAHGVEARLYTNAALTGYRSEPWRSASASAGREMDLLDILARVTSVPCSDPVVLARAALSGADALAYLLIVPHADAGAEAAMAALSRGGGAGTRLIAVDALEVD